MPNKLFLLFCIFYMACSSNPVKEVIEEENTKKEILPDLSKYQLNNTGAFKKSQKEFSRVREAYKNKAPLIAYYLHKSKIEQQKLEIYLQAFKKEDKLIIWAKNKDQKEYTLFKEYPICKKSGKLGPKRKEGDKQVPEGFYHIDKLNPNSRFHLSMHVNYPNPADKILSNQEQPGGDIMVHGNCATIGCIPIQDGPIEELYILVVEAMNNGQKTIPLTIFPLEPSPSFPTRLLKGEKESTIQLWKDLEAGYKYFDKHRKLPNISFKRNEQSKVME